MNLKIRKTLKENIDRIYKLSIFLFSKFTIMLLDFENPIRNFLKVYIGASKINAKNNKRKMIFVTFLLLPFHI